MNKNWLSVLNYLFLWLQQLNIVNFSDKKKLTASRKWSSFLQCNVFGEISQEITGAQSHHPEYIWWNSALGVITGIKCLKDIYASCANCLQHLEVFSFSSYIRAIFNSNGIFSFVESRAILWILLWKRAKDFCLSKEEILQPRVQKI